MSAISSDDDSQILINDGIQAPKPLKIRAPLIKKHINLNYEKVAEIIKNESPLVIGEAADEVEIARLEAAIAEMNPKKPRKQRKDAGIHKDMSKASAARAANLDKQRLMKEQLKAEYDKKHQDMIIKKAVAIKKAQMKQDKLVQSVSEEVPKVPTKPIPIPKPEAPVGPKYQFF